MTTEKNLHSFLKMVEKNLPEEYVEVDREVDPLGELTQVVQKLASVGNNSVVRFNHVKGSSIPVVTNVNSSLSKLALAFDTTQEGLLGEYIKREKSLLKPRIVNDDDAPVQEIVVKGDDVDLGKLPIVKNCYEDAGPFVNAAATISRDPDLHHHNSGIYRMQVHDRNHLGAFFDPSNKIFHIFSKFEKKNEPMDVALVIGLHPAALLATQSKLPFGTDAYEIMGALQGEPLDLVKCKTVDLLVPSRAEIIIEGKLLPNVRKHEGPYGEYTWTYGEGTEGFVIEISAITMRRDAIYRHIFAGHMEHNYTGLLPREAIIYNRIKAMVPSVKAVNMPIGGLCRFVAYISIKKEFEGAGRNAALIALGGDVMLKQVVVVDEDINVFDEAEVLWAVATRAQADRAILLIPDAGGSNLDPSSYSWDSRSQRGFLHTKWALDATRPLVVESQKRVEVMPGWEKLRLNEYIAKRKS